MLLLLLNLAEASESHQILIYDLLLSGEPVGHRTVDITYQYPVEGELTGSRKIDSMTVINFEKMGQSISYQQNVTGRFSSNGTQFVSIVQLNDERFELQGKQRSNRTWVINEILPSGVLKHVFSPADIQDISLALFDPKQSDLWRSGPQSIYEVEMGTIWSGDWTELGEQSIQNNDKSVYGRTLRYHSDQGEMTGTWSNEGLLIDWELSIMGITLDAKLRNIPDNPNFGEIQVDNSFSGVEEEEL